jgi:RNA polymerase sigma-70 factor (ECF subfamily)
VVHGEIHVPAGTGQAEDPPGRHRVPGAGAARPAGQAQRRAAGGVSGFTEGHLAAGGDALIRGDLCDQAIRLARALTALLPGEPEATGLLAPERAYLARRMHEW